MKRRHFTPLGVFFFLNYLYVEMVPFKVIFNPNDNISITVLTPLPRDLLSFPSALRHSQPHNFQKEKNLSPSIPSQFRSLARPPPTIPLQGLLHCVCIFIIIIIICLIDASARVQTVIEYQEQTSTTPFLIICLNCREFEKKKKLDNRI